MEACCWNGSQGCTFVGAVGRMLCHYEYECSFDAVTCPRCFARVLSRDVLTHLRELFEHVCISGHDFRSRQRTFPAIHSADIRRRPRRLLKVKGGDLGSRPGAARPSRVI